VAPQSLGAAARRAVARAVRIAPPSLLAAQLGVLAAASSLETATSGEPKPKRVRVRREGGGVGGGTAARGPTPADDAPSPPPLQAPRRPRSAEAAAPARASTRLAAAPPKFFGDDWAVDFSDALGRPAGAAGPRHREIERLLADGGGWCPDALRARRMAGSASRGTVYDSLAGVTCHFCRQKKLCGEPGCPRCDARDPAQPCAGKSECSRCGGPTGRFCRACLDVRYGQCLDAVREAAAGDGWLCPHCYEGVHGPADGWICNSSICLKRKGIPPTGIAVFDARAAGHASVAHALQARLAPGAGVAGPRAYVVAARDRVAPRPPAPARRVAAADAAAAGGGEGRPAKEGRPTAPRARTPSPGPPARAATPPPPSGPRAALWRRRVVPKRVQGW